jgi:hypothetical protein
VSREELETLGIEGSFWVTLGRNRSLEISRDYCYVKGTVGVAVKVKNANFRPMPGRGV